MKIETPRLILREFMGSDLQVLAPILADPLVMKFSTMGIYSTPQTEKAIDNFIDSYKQFGFGLWAVILKESDDLLIGYCGLAVDRIDDRDEPEIAYRLDSNFWGEGFATEAALSSIQYGFDSDRIAIHSGCSPTTKCCIYSSVGKTRYDIRSRNYFSRSGYGCL
jgi:RimJ/RimL family protein N-acetyltransferase